MGILRVRGAGVNGKLNIKLDASSNDPE